MKTKKILFILVISSLVFLACQSIALATPTTTFVPPTNTPNPTNTPKPTNTPVPPTPTIVPPAVLTEYLENANIIKFDTLDNSVGWEVFEGSKIANGVLEIVGHDWNGVANKGVFQEGSGILINFKYTKGANFELLFDKGAWDTDPYKRFGVYLAQDYAESNLWDGKKGLGFNYLRGNFYLAPDTWYSLLMALGKDGDFFALVYDPTNPDKIIKDRRQIENWKGIDWTFRIGAGGGTILFDDFHQVKFDSIK